MAVTADERPVLIVDDAATYRDILLRAFRRAAPGRRVTPIADPRDVAGLLADVAGTPDEPALAIVDINMPEQSGLELLTELRATAPLLPTLVLSGSARPHDLEIAYRNGAAGFFEKPMGMEALVEVVRTIDRYWFGTAALPQLPLPDGGQ